MEGDAIHGALLNMGDGFVEGLAAVVHKLLSLLYQHSVQQRLPGLSRTASGAHAVATGGVPQHQCTGPQRHPCSVREVSQRM